MSPIRNAVILTALLAALPAPASERRLEIAPVVGVESGATLHRTYPEISRAEAGPALSLGVSFGWWVREDGWLEVLFDRQILRFESSSIAGTDRFNIGVDYLHVGGGYEPPREGLRPFVTVSAGLTNYSSDPGQVEDSLGLSGSVGGGFKAPLGKRALFRLEARGWATLTSGSASIVCGPGCSFSFGGSGWWQLGLRAAVAFIP